jgi:hypothetical protein
MEYTGKFLDKFSNDRRFSLPLPFQWTVTIDTSSGLVSEIKNALGKINQSWAVQDSSLWTDKEANNILVAQEVTLPPESFEATVLGQENRGAFMPGYGTVQRTDFLSRNITINFLETERDIETELFRPWLIALSIEGLINSRLKSTINVTQYTKDMKPRRKYTFNNVFPTNSEGYTINYGDQEFFQKTVTFGYNNYYIEEIGPTYIAPNIDVGPNLTFPQNLA